LEESWDYTDFKQSLVNSVKVRHFSFDITETKQLEKLTDEKKNKYLLELRINVFTILSRQQSGMDSDTLEKKLHENLNTFWTYSVFNCSKFHLFMLEYLKDIVEVEMKYTDSAKFTYIFYLKNSKFKNKRHNLSFKTQVNSLIQGRDNEISKKKSEETRSVKQKKVCNSSQNWNNSHNLKVNNHLNILNNLDPINKESSFLKDKGVHGEIERPNNSFTFLSGIYNFRTEDNVSFSAYNDLGKVL
jgi:hypothetical protein